MMVNKPTLLQLVRWLTSITRPVHKPLYVSTCFRILSLSLDVILFSLAAGGVISVLIGEGHSSLFLVLLILIAIIKAFCYYCEQLTGHYVAFKALELLRTMVFSQLWPKTPAILGHSRSGDILTSLTRDVDRIEVVYAHTFAPLVSAFVIPTAFLLAAGMLVGWSVVAIPAFCILLALTVVPFLGLGRSMRATHHTLRLRRKLAHHVTDSVFGAEEVVGYGRQDERLMETDRLGVEIADSARIARSGNAIRRTGNLMLSLMAVVGTVYAARNAEISLSLTAALAIGVFRLFEGPKGVEDAAGYLDHSLAAAKRLWEINTAPNVIEDGLETYQPKASSNVEFEDVSYAHKDGLFTLKHLNFTVSSGEHIAIVGPSGSGKTTAVSLILRYDDPISGRILLDGIPIQRYTLESLRRAVAIVTQREQLLNASIRENVTLGAPQSDDAAIWEVLDMVCLANEIRDMPEGLDTSVGQSGRNISGGQAQRLCLARALLMKPRVLVLDEFTAHLNDELDHAIRDNLAAWDRRPTVIEISHRLDATRSADRVFLMDRGRIIASGDPAQIEESNGTIGEFFRSNVGFPD